MKGTQTIWAVTILLTALAAFVDFRSRKIPNWLTVPAFVAGVAPRTGAVGCAGGGGGTLRAVLCGGPGAKSALEGTGLALLVLLPLVLMRALGAGDWKLMGAVGAFLGPWMFVFVLLASVFLSGLMAIAMMIFTHRVKTTLRNLLVLVQGFFVFGLRPNPEISLDNPTLLKLPF